MSGVSPPDRAVPAGDPPRMSAPHELPDYYGDAYRRAYRESLAAHPTALMSPVRPGKRAAEPGGRAGFVARFEDLVMDVLASPRKRLIVGGALSLSLVLLAYVAGRLAA